MARKSLVSVAVTNRRRGAERTGSGGAGDGSGGTAADWISDWTH